MALQDRPRVGLYDSKGKPRLDYARKYFHQFGLEVGSNFNELQEFYLEWVNFDEYLILQRQMKSWKIKGRIERETILYLKKGKHNPSLFLSHKIASPKNDNRQPVHI